jgi:hypothetical protein
MVLAVALLVATLVMAHKVERSHRSVRAARAVSWLCTVESALYLTGLVTTALVIGLGGPDYFEAYSSLTGYDGSSFYFGHEVSIVTASGLNVGYLVGFVLVLGVQVTVVSWLVGWTVRPTSTPSRTRCGPRSPPRSTRPTACSAGPSTTASGRSRSRPG